MTVLRSRATPPLSIVGISAASTGTGLPSGPNAASPTDIQLMRIAGLSDREIFEATVHVAFRLAFSIVNGSLGVIPDHQLVAAAPPQIRDEVTYGRPAAVQLIDRFKPSSENAR